MGNSSGSKSNIFSWYELTDDAIKFLWTHTSTATCKLCLKLSRMHIIHIWGLALPCYPKPTAHDLKLITGFTSLQVTLISSKEISEKADGSYFLKTKTVLNILRL